jgi:hypothetical protein
METEQIHRGLGSAEARLTDFTREKGVVSAQMRSHPAEGQRIAGLSYPDSGRDCRNQAPYSDIGTASSAYPASYDYPAPNRGQSPVGSANEIHCAPAGTEADGEHRGPNAADGQQWMESTEAQMLPNDEIIPREVIPIAPDSKPSPSTLRVSEIDFHADRRYEEFVTSQPSALIFHQPGWLCALEAEYRGKFVVLACENRDGRLEGVLPLLYTRGLPFNIGRQQMRRRLSSLPRTPLAGPVFTSAESAILLLRAAVSHVKAESCTQLQIKSKTKLATTTLQNDLLLTIWRPTYVLEVPELPEDFRFGKARNRHNIKWAVKKAEKQGVRVRDADNEHELRAWYSLYLQTMRRNVVPPRPLRLFLAMWRNLVPKGLMRLQLAEQFTGCQRRLVAGSIFLRFHDTVWYAFTGVADKGLVLHPNDLILWHAINGACGTGIRYFDFGEVAEGSPELVRFKTKWGARPKDQYRYYFGDTESCSDNANNKWKSRCLTTEVLSRIWQYLPLQMTARLGDCIYSRL